jgi:hypothetical protein
MMMASVDVDTRSTAPAGVDIPYDAITLATTVAAVMNIRLMSWLSASERVVLATGPGDVHGTVN